MPLAVEPISDAQREPSGLRAARHGPAGSCQHVVDAEDFRQIRDAVRPLVRESVVPREERIEEDDRIPDDLRAQAADMGLFGYALPEEYGGLGVTMSEDVQLAFEFGYTTPAFRSLFGTNNGIAGQVIARFDPAPGAGRRRVRAHRPRRRRLDVPQLRDQSARGPGTFAGSPAGSRIAPPVGWNNGPGAPSPRPRAATNWRSTSSPR